MPAAANLDAHKAYLEVWQQALEAPRGIRVRTASPLDFRARMYHARAADRRANAKIYPPDHLMHSKSYFDALAIKLEADAVRIVPTDIEIEGVEQL
jgi:hypothetical protein